MKNFLRKVLVFLTIIAMLMSTMPQGALAASDSTQASSTTQGDTFPMGPSSAVTLQSLVDSNGYLTDEGLQSLQNLPDDPQKYTEKVDNGDGTKSVRLYVNPIKYKDSNGKYQTIDNSIISADAETQPEYQYQNAASDIQVLMSDNLNQNSAIELNYQGYSIGFKPLGVLNSNGVSTADLKFVQTNNTNLQDASIDKSKKYNAVNYSGTFDSNTNIEIRPNSNGTKEDIILNKMPSITKFSYQISVKNAVPILRQDGNLYFVDLSKGLIVASIPIPCMYDSTPESGSVDIPVTLQKVGTDTYKYTLLPDQNFLKNATYPVVIDPTINTQSGGLYDTEVRNDTSSNYSTLNLMAVGCTSSNVVFRSLIGINQDEIDSIQSTIHGVVTNVSFHEYESYSGASSPTIELHPITSAWTYNTVNWAGQPSFDSLTTSQVVQAVKWYTWDITDVGLDWYYNTTSNYGKKTYGILFKNDNETLNMYKEFNTDENSSYNDYFQFTYTSDTTSPTATISKSNPGWNQPVTLTCTASDVGSGVDDVLLGGRNLLRHSSTAKTGSNEFLKYADIAPIIGQYGLVKYTISFDIKSANTSTANTATVYCQNGSTTRYQFYASVPVTTSYTRQTVVVTPTLYDNTQTQAFLAFYGTYGTGNILSVKNVKVEVGSNDLESSYTSAPEDVYNSKSLTRTVSSNGTYHFTVSDYAFNVTVPSITITNFGPSQPASVTTNPVATSTWTNNASPTLSWSGITDGVGCGLSCAQYQVDGTDPGSWKSIPISDGIGSGSTGISITSAGTHTIYVRGLDNDGTGGPTNSVVYKLDNIKPSTPSISTTPAASSSWTNDATPVLGWSNSTDNTGGSGMNRLQWKVNSTPWADIPSSTGATGTYNLPTLTSSGTYTYYAHGVDNATNISSTDASVVYKLDIDKPVPPTKVTTNPVATTTYTNDTSLTLTATGITDAGGSGLDHTEYQVDGTTEGNWTTFVSGNTINITTSGTHTIYVRGVDGAKNAGAYLSVVYKLDVTGPTIPTISTIPVASSTWSKIKSISLSWSNITDAHSGLSTTSPSQAHVEYQVDAITEGSWVSIPVSYGVATGSYTIALSATGSHAIYVRGVDYLGNKGTIGQVGYMLDVTPPTEPTSLTSNPAASSTWTSNTTPTISWSGITDADSGMTGGFSKAQYQRDGGDWVGIPTSSGIAAGKDVALPAFTISGIHIIKVRGMDAVGNVSDSITKLLVYQIDTASPENVIGYAYVNGVNHISWLEAQSGINGTGVTYNIYRGTSASFIISASNRLNTADANGMGITQTEWDDTTATAGTTYYYKVTAIKNAAIQGAAVYRESLPSAAISVTSVDSDELSKRVGLQSYWQYSPFSGGAGSGSVNVSSGNVVFQSEDFTFPSLIPMTMTRVYNSQSTATSTLGKGWDFSFDIQLFPLSNGDMILKEGDGTLHRFIHQVDGTYKPEAGLFMKLEYLDAYSFWKITLKDNTMYMFTSDKKLAMICDLNGNYLYFEYYPQGGVKSITSSANEAMNFEYYTASENNVSVNLPVTISRA